MRPIETEDDGIEITWDDFGIRRTDFRPHFDGDLINVFSSIETQGSEGSTLNYVLDCTMKMAAWILENKNLFGNKDRFQLIIGWKVSEREFSRQIVKTGGTFEELGKILNGEILIEPRKHWSKGIF